jgi:hypothetical protein
MWQEIIYKAEGIYFLQQYADCHVMMTVITPAISQITILCSKQELISSLCQGIKLPDSALYQPFINHGFNLILTNFRRIQWRNSVSTPVENVAHHVMWILYQGHWLYIIYEYISHKWLLIWSLHQHFHKFKMWGSQSHDGMLYSAD